MKEEHLLKPPLGQIPIISSHGGIIKGSEATSPTNPDKGRTRKRKKIMQAIISIVQLVTKHDWCMAPNPLRNSVNYSRNIPISMPCSGPTNKPAPAATKIVVSPSSLMEKSKS